MKNKYIEVASPQVGEEEAVAVREVLLSGNYISNQKVKQFEEEFAKYISVDNAIAVNSGTAALHISMMALDIGKGDNIITSPITFSAK